MEGQQETPPVCPSSLPRTMCEGQHVAWQQTVQDAAIGPRDVVGADQDTGRC